MQITKKIIFNIYSLFKNNRNTVITNLLIAILADIFLIGENYDFVTFTILVISVFSVIVYRFKSSTIFIFCLVLLGIMYLLFLLHGTSSATEKAAVWIFLFLIVGIIRQWKE